MPIRGKESWRRRAALGAVAFAGTVAVGALSEPVAAQYSYDYGYGYPGPTYSYPPQSYSGYSTYPPYGQQYNGGGNWGSGRQWQDRSWSGESRRGSANRGDSSQGRGGDRGRSEGRTGSSGGQGGGVGSRQGSGAGGNGDPNNSWLGSHGSFR